MLGRRASTERAEEARLFATSILAQTPHVTNVLFADAAGDFLLVTRAANQAGSFQTKQITAGPGARSVVWTTRNTAGAVTERREDPADTYDAGTRAWFTGARTNDDVFWTSPYVFFSERAPGVTAAVHGPEHDPDVIGIDIRLDALSGFLGALSIGRSGKAYLVTRNGDMIAGPDAARLMQTKDGALKPNTVDGVGDADLAASWDHYRVEGLGTRVIEAGGRRLISIVTPLSAQADAAAQQPRLAACDRCA